MTSRRIVLFDIDGTLMRGAGPQHKHALITAAKQVMKLDCTLDGIDTSGQLDRDLLLIMLTNAGAPKYKVIDNMTRLMEAAQHHYSVHCKADFSKSVCPGVIALLDLLTEHKIPLGLVTGNLSSIAWRKLENAGIHKHFSFGAFAEEATTRARLAKLALWHAKRKDIAAWSCQTTLIGDHANDVQAAKSNGFRSVAVATGFMPAEELSRLNPDLLLPTLEGASIKQICG